MHFYTENKFSGKLLGQIFYEDYIANKYLSNKNFQVWLKVTKKFTKAQSSITEKEQNLESFFVGSRFQQLSRELPELSKQIYSSFEKVCDRLKNVPFVLTHGDLNPYNMFKDGVIDFGNHFNGPFGYDLITNLFQIYFFPNSTKYELHNKFIFSQKQISDYFKNIEIFWKRICANPIKDYVDDLIFSRSVWLTSNLQEMPILQGWRYKNFKKIIKAYMSNESLSALVQDIKHNS